MTDSKQVKRLRKAFRLYKARRDRIQALNELWLTGSGMWLLPSSFINYTYLVYQKIISMEIAESILEGRQVNWYLTTWLPIKEQIRRTVTNYI